MADQFFGQLLALAAFFAFPIVQYVFLWCTSKNEGKAELWYLPDHGFRLVMRNIPRRRTFYNVRYKSLVRDLIPPSKGSSVGSWKDDEILNVNEFFLLPGSDQTLLQYNLSQNGSGLLHIERTDKSGKVLSKHPVGKEAKLVADYEATLKNWFHFDVRVARRVEISESGLRSSLEQIEEHDIEQYFDICQIINVM
jgi:hypothetical protein